jgi:hypothetical protein
MATNKEMLQKGVKYLAALPLCLLAQALFIMHL